MKNFNWGGNLLPRRRGEERMPYQYKIWETFLKIRFLHYGRNDGLAWPTAFIIIFCVLFSCLTVLPVIGQEAVGLNNVRPLKVGDNIPDELWEIKLRVVNSQQNEVLQTLDQLLGDKELLILDFWATWCRSCVEAFPKIDQLNKDFSDKIAVIPVTMEDPAKVRKWFAMHDRSLRTAYVLDSARSLYSYFPHNILPHVVILSRSSVPAIIAGKELTAKNINNILLGNKTEIANKKDSVTYDNTKPLLISDVNSKENGFIARSIFTDTIEGVGSMYSVSRDSLQHRIIYKVVNLPFKEAWSLVFRDQYKLRSNQVIIPQEAEGLMNKNFCYELIYPMDKMDRAPQKVKQDLESFFGYTADTVIRNELTIVLQEKKETTNSNQQANVDFLTPFYLEDLREWTATGLVFMLNQGKKSPVFAIDTIKSKKELPSPSLGGRVEFKNLGQLNQWLNRADLEFAQQTNPVKYIIYKKLEL